MTVPAEFEQGVQARSFDLGRGVCVWRFEHPALPGRPIIATTEPGLPVNREACIKALHAQLTQLSQDFDIL